MEHRHPSVASSLTLDRLSIRRRSGKLNPSSPNGSDSAYSSPTESSDPTRNSSREWAFPSDDYDAIIHRKPTVLLVNPLHSSRRHPSGPHFPLQSAPLEDPAFVPLESDRVVIHRSSNASPVQHIGPDLLSPVNCSEITLLSTYGSNQSSEKFLTPLPTPDATANRNRSFLSTLSRRLNFLHFGRPHRLPSSAFTMVMPVEHRPQSIRSVSNYSTSSMDSETSDASRRSSSSVDSGHSSLISSINTTGKFTHKWPRPQSLFGPSAISTTDTGGAAMKSLSQAEVVLIEEGRCLQAKKSEQWTAQKRCLLVSVFIVLVYGIACLGCTIMAWLRIWSQADVMYTAENDVLILATLTGSLLIFAGLVGMTGVFLNSRLLLATYAILLWPGLISMTAVGFITYKRFTFSLDHKLDLAWSQWYTPEGRLLIQDVLRCCGWYNVLHEAIPSKQCYPRTPLPGCKSKLYRFEKENLGMIQRAAFSLVPLHILNIIVALLCANHITKRFGDGIIPKKYRLSTFDLKADAEKILIAQGVRDCGHLKSSIRGR